MYEFTHVQFWALLISVVGMVAISIAWYYEHQLKKGDETLDDVRADLYYLVCALGSFPRQVRQFNEQDRAELKALVITCQSYSEGMLAHEVCTQPGFDHIHLDTV